MRPPLASRHHGMESFNKRFITCDSLKKCLMSHSQSSEFLNSWRTEATWRSVRTQLSHHLPHIQELFHDQTLSQSRADCQCFRYPEYPRVCTSNHQEQTLESQDVQAQPPCLRRWLGNLHQVHSGPHLARQAKVKVARKPGVTAGICDSVPCASMAASCSIRNPK